MPRPDGLDVVADAGRRLGVDEGDHRRGAMRLENGGGVEGLAPRRVHPDHLRPEASGHVAHALAEQPVHAHDHHVAGADQIDERGLHAGRAGSAHRQRQRVLGPVHRPQPLARLVEDGQELRVQVPEHGAGEGRDDLGVGVGGSGTHEDPVAVQHPRMLGTVDAVAARPGQTAPARRRTWPGRKTARATVRPTANRRQSPPIAADW